MIKPKTDIDSLFSTAKHKDTYLKICAPMVRYSKLQFRNLVRKYGVDMCFTPMILADSFCQSAKARDNEFSTNSLDTPLIVQFAAKTVYDFVGASELVYPFADGVDLNCGCPQRWAIKDGYGCGLLSKPEIIHDLIRNFKNRLSNDFTVSVKIRLLNDLKSTVELCRNIEKCGVNFLTVHGRKIWQKSSEPVDVSTLKDIRTSLSVPFVVNGGIKCLQDSDTMFKTIKCDGIMAAQGILTNPAMFLESDTSPIDCVQNWIDICYNERRALTFQCFHHHLVFMLEKFLKKREKQVFNNLSTFSSVYDYLDKNLDVRPHVLDMNMAGKDIFCEYDFKEYSALKEIFGHYDETYDSNLSHGNFFLNHISKEKCDLDNMDHTLFAEL